MHTYIHTHSSNTLFTHTLHTHSPEDLDELYTSIDTDEDGSVNYEELFNAVNGKPRVRSRAASEVRLGAGPAGGAAGQSGTEGGDGGGGEMEGDMGRDSAGEVGPDGEEAIPLLSSSSSSSSSSSIYAMAPPARGPTPTSPFREEGDDEDRWRVHTWRADDSYNVEVDGDVDWRNQATMQVIGCLEMFIRLFSYNVDWGNQATMQVGKGRGAGKGGWRRGWRKSGRERPFDVLI